MGSADGVEGVSYVVVPDCGAELVAALLGKPTAEDKARHDRQIKPIEQSTLANSGLPHEGLMLRRLHVSNLAAHATYVRARVRGQVRGTPQSNR